MLKVIGAGFPRTGTTSLKAALDRLGFGPTHHMHEVVSRPGQAERWLPVLSDDPVDWDRVFDGYHSAVDWPAGFFWRQLMDAYPEAKIILSVRDSHGWYESFRTLITRPPAPEPGKVPRAMEHMMRMRPVMDLMGRTTFGDAWEFGVSVPEEADAVEVFRRHVETVKATVPAGRLLVFEAGQGWGPLCDFLGVQAPEGEPYPHLNDSRSVSRNFERAEKGESFLSPYESAS